MGQCARAASLGGGREASHASCTTKALASGAGSSPAAGRVCSAKPRPLALQSEARTPGFLLLLLPCRTQAPFLPAPQFTPSAQWVHSVALHANPPRRGPTCQAGGGVDPLQELAGAELAAVRGVGGQDGPARVQRPAALHGPAAAAPPGRELTDCLLGPGASRRRRRRPGHNPAPRSAPPPAPLPREAVTRAPGLGNLRPGQVRAQQPTAGRAADTPGALGGQWHEGCHRGASHRAPCLSKVLFMEAGSAPWHRSGHRPSDLLGSCFSPGAPPILLQPSLTSVGRACRQELAGLLVEVPSQ